MNEKSLIQVERTTALLAALIIGVAWLFFTRKALFSVSVGAGLMVANTLLLRQISRRAARVPKERGPGAMLLMFNLKMGVLVALIWVVMRYLPVDPVYFVVGISVFPVGIIVTAVRSALAPAEADASSSPPGATHG